MGGGGGFLCTLFDLLCVMNLEIVLYICMIQLVN